MKTSILITLLLALNCLVLIGSDSGTSSSDYDFNLYPTTDQTEAPTGLDPIQNPWPNYPYATLTCGGSPSNNWLEIWYVDSPSTERKGYASSYDGSVTLNAYIYNIVGKHVVHAQWSTCDGVQDSKEVTITIVGIMSVTCDPSVVWTGAEVDYTATPNPGPEWPADSPSFKLDPASGGTPSTAEGIPTVAVVTTGGFSGDLKGEFSMGSSGASESNYATAKIVKLESLSVSPSDTTVAVGTTLTFTATVTSGGESLGGDVTWTSSHAGYLSPGTTQVITVDSSDIGTFTVTASGSPYWNDSKTITINVVANIFSVSISPAMIDWGDCDFGEVTGTDELDQLAKDLQAAVAVVNDPRVQAGAALGDDEKAAILQAAKDEIERIKARFEAIQISLSQAQGQGNPQNSVVTITGTPGQTVSLDVVVTTYYAKKDGVDGLGTLSASSVTIPSSGSTTVDFTSNGNYGTGNIVASSNGSSQSTSFAVVGMTREQAKAFIAAKYSAYQTRIAALEKLGTFILAVAVAFAALALALAAFGQPHAAFIAAAIAILAALIGALIAAAVICFKRMAELWKQRADGLADLLPSTKNK